MDINSLAARSYLKGSINIVWLPLLPPSPPSRAASFMTRSVGYLAGGPFLLRAKAGGHQPGRDVLRSKMATRFCNYCEEMLDEIEILVVEDERKLVCGRCKEAYEEERDRRVDLERKEMG